MSQIRSSAEKRMGLEELSLKEIKVDTKETKISVENKSNCRE